jgi:hypothetical protein
MLKANARALLFTVGGFIFFAVAFFPGFMTFDSIKQFTQAQTLHFTDWHPPVMAWLWSKLNIIYDKPQNLLFLQLGVFWGGLYLWYRTHQTNYPDKKNILFILIGFLPWVANFEGVLWKDVGMAFSLLLALGLLSTNKKLSKTNIILVILFLLYGFMVRYNAPAALIPIVWYLYAKLFPEHPHKAKIAGALLIFISMFAFQYLFNYKIVQAQKTHAVAYMMIDDLTHLSLAANKSLLPNANYENIEKCSQETIADTVLVGRIFCSPPLETYLTIPNGLATIPESTYESIKNAWVSAVKQNPSDYLQFRLKTYFYLLRFPSGKPYSYWVSGISPNTLGLVQKDNIATVILKNYVNTTANFIPFLFKPYWWLLVALLLLGSTFFVDYNRECILLIRVLLASAILYMLSYILVTPLADFRYVYWSTLAISIAIIIFLKEAVNEIN